MHPFFKWRRGKFSLPLAVQDGVDFLRNRRNTNSSVPRKAILVQAVEDVYYFCLFGSIISEISKHGNFRIEQYISRSFHVDESNNFIRFILYRLSNLILGIKWVNAYKSFAPFIGFKLLKTNPFFDLLDAANALKSYFLISSHDDLISLSIKNIYVGDLVNDTFLRFKPSPKMVISDLYLLFIIWHAHRMVRITQKYFTRTPPTLFLSSYSTYLQHGIAVRVALICGVPVYTFGNYQQFSKKLSIEDYYHTKDTKNYRIEFELLGNKEQCLKLAEEKFKRKIAGEVHPYFSYMRNSAYTKTEQDIPIVHGATIIFLHDFFDSPHIYPDMIFHDFWDWISYTIESLESKNIKFFIKPHPNQINLNDEVIACLIQKYPNLKFISPKITNTQLIDGGIVSAITAYGTVAHEMAYFGIPSIMCARHPQLAFSFCLTARSREEYKRLIHSALVFENLDEVKMRKESLEFYFMHNLNLTTKESQLMLAAHNLRSGCNALSEENTPNLVELIKNLSSKEGFKEFCKKIALEASGTDDLR